jgi:alpha-N-acetylglucosaminidase
MPYKPENLVKALELLLADSDRLAASDAYRYDVVDIARQVLSNLGQPINKKAAAAFKAKDKKQFAAESARFLELLGDVDTLLASRPEFLFGKWTADARSWGSDDKAKAYYEWNASMLVTIWGPENAPTIFDYSWREWSGLISQYYQPRWKRFYAHLGQCLAEGKTYKDPKKQVYGREAFRANEFYNQLADWEQQFIHTHHPLSAKPKGDEIELAKKMLEKYTPAIKAAYSE